MIFFFSHSTIHLGRSVIFKLFNLMGETPQDKIKSILGVDGKNVDWRNHSIFQWIRSGYTKVFPLRPNPHGVYTLTQTPIGENCHFSSVGTVYLNTAISEGIFRWTVRITYPTEEESYICVGAAPYRRMNIFSFKPLAWTDMTFTYCGSYCLHYCLRPNGKGWRSFFGSWNRFDHPDDTLPTLPNNSLVSIEADVTANTLSFFIDRKKVNCVAKFPKSIPPFDYGFPLNLGVSGTEGVSFTSLNLRRLAAPTPSPVPCRVFEFEHHPVIEID